MILEWENEERNTRERDTVACVFASPLREETVSANNLIEEKMFSQDFAIERQLCFVEKKGLSQSSVLCAVILREYLTSANLYVIRSRIEEQMDRWNSLSEKLIVRKIPTRGNSYLGRVDRKNMPSTSGYLS